MLILWRFKSAPVHMSRSIYHETYRKDRGKIYPRDRWRLDIVINGKRRVLSFKTKKEALEYEYETK